MPKLFANSAFFACVNAKGLFSLKLLPALSCWLLVYGVLWYVLSGGAGWAFGAPCVGLASLLAVYLQRQSQQPRGIQPRHLPLFLLFFIRSALRGGLDVAHRALHPRCPIAPAWVRYPFTTDNSGVRLLVSAIIGLFPGTLASKIDGDELWVHVLDETADWRSTVEKLEQQLAQLLSATQHQAGKD